MFFNDTRQGSVTIFSYSNWDKDKCMSCYIQINGCCAHLLICSAQRQPISALQKPDRCHAADVLQGSDNVYKSF